MDFKDKNGGKGGEEGHSEHEKMGMRGVTRPMGEGHMNEHQKQSDKGGQNKMSSMMNVEQKKEMLKMHHKQTLWVFWMIILLGFWVLFSPLTFSYAKESVMPSGGREVWLSLTGRINAMTWSDIISGLLLIIFGYRALTPNRPKDIWICCAIGVWLSIAPIIFWSPSATAYLNGTFIGAMIIALTILIPGMPNMIMQMEMGPTTPPGWSYNPSSWPQRWIMIVTGFAGWLVSRYLAAYQLGYIDYVWDPFFGDSSMKVLDSKMSHSLPISDAALGSLAYTFEFLMGFMGSPARWRTMPWMVTLFGILVIPLGLVHIFLVISQPIVVGYWCTLCIVAAGIMLPMIPLEVDEVIAMGQFMVQATKKGEPFWKVFWKGGTVEGGSKDERSPELLSFPQKTKKVFKASIWGMTFSRRLVICTFIGIGLMAAPEGFGVGIQETSADICHLLGALIVVTSVISMAEVIRAGRFINILLGIALIVGLWIANNNNTPLAVTAILSGILVIVLSIPFGPKTEQYGLWEKYIK